MPPPVHVLVAGPLHEAGREILESAPGFDMRYVEETSEESYAPFIAEADAVLIRTQPMSAATIANADRLKIVSRHGVGYDAVNVDALSARGIALAVCGNVNSLAVAEHSLMLMLAASHRLIRADASVRSGPWEWRNRLEAQELTGRNLLILGYGRIGREVARLANGFGMRIRAYDPYLEQQGWPEGGAGPVSNLGQGLEWADVVSVNTPHTGEPLISAAEIARMRKGAILINTARGGVVDEQALAQALQDGRLGAAGIDVFEDEPMPSDHPFTDLDNVVLTPHIAGLTSEAAQRLAANSAQNIVDFFAGHLDPDLIVNKEQLHVPQTPT